MILDGKSITTPLGAFFKKESCRVQRKYYQGVFVEKSKISAKGQLVIPKYLRDALGMKEGTEVMIEKSEDKLIIMKKPDDPVKGLVSAAGKVSMKNVRRRIKEE
jgi:AbrB family looped-hinge helix DNA binding protein